MKNNTVEIHKMLSEIFDKVYEITDFHFVNGLKKEQLHEIIDSAWNRVMLDNALVAGGHISKEDLHDR